MEFLADLWVPIIVSGVGVFIVSSIIHMALPWHKSDYQHFENEEETLAAFIGKDYGPGMYMFPGAKSMAEIGTPEYKARCERGPVGYMILHESKLWNMPRSLLHWFILSIVISIFTAYVTNFCFQWKPTAPEDGEIFRLAGTVGTMAYAFTSPVDSIWKGVSWAVSFRFVIDGILYGLTTGAVFAWLW